MKPVILLVDDEEDFVSVLQDAIDLSLPAYRAVCATSVDDAESVLRDLQGELSLICVDQRLGGRTGVDFIEGLEHRYRDVPSVLLTGQASPREEERAKRVGAHVLWKPLQLSDWLGEIKSLLLA